jgi:5-methylcytosine-specific restriction endonuclease McrA
MRSHHKQAHGESIAGFEFTCEWCGEDGVKSQIDDRDDHQFCSTGCYHEWRAETLVGDNSPVWEGRTIVVECEWCGEPTEKAMVRYEKNEHAFCSRRCHGDWVSKNRHGPNSPLWRGGDNICYGPNWQKQREKRLEYDNHECVICGMNNEEHKQTYANSLHVHHITPAREFLGSGSRIDYERANRIENLLTMCVKCHSRYEGVPLDTTAGAVAVEELKNELD